MKKLFWKGFKRVIFGYTINMAFVSVVYSSLNPPMTELKTRNPAYLLRLDTFDKEQLTQADKSESIPLENNLEAVQKVLMPPCQA